MRYLGSERRDFTFSYVHSHGTADLNNYDQFFGNLRNPIIRENENNLIPTDVPHRLMVRGTMGLPASGCLRRSSRCDPASPGLPSTSSSISWDRAAAPGGSRL